MNERYFRTAHGFSTAQVHFLRPLGRWVVRMLSRYRHFVLLAFACAALAPTNAQAAIVGTSTVDGGDVIYSAEQCSRMTLDATGRFVRGQG